MSLTDSLVYLWLFPVALQIILPLGLLVGFLGKRLCGNFLGRSEVTAHHNNEIRQSI
jgi:hypothetical protein